MFCAATAAVATAAGGDAIRDGRLPVVAPEGGIDQVDGRAAVDAAVAVEALPFGSELLPGVSVAAARGGAREFASLLAAQREPRVRVPQSRQRVVRTIPLLDGGYMG